MKKKICCKDSSMDKHKDKYNGTLKKSGWHYLSTWLLWTFICTGFMTSFVCWYPAYSISGEKRYDFLALALSPSLLSHCSSLTKCWRCSSKIPLLMIGRSSKYIQTNSKPNIMLGIFSWKISGEYYIYSHQSPEALVLSPCSHYGANILGIWV